MASAPAPEPARSRRVRRWGGARLVRRLIGGRRPLVAPGEAASVTSTHRASPTVAADVVGGLPTLLPFPLLARLRRAELGRRAATAARQYTVDSGAAPGGVARRSIRSSARPAEPTVAALIAAPPAGPQIRPGAVPAVRPAFVALAADPGRRFPWGDARSSAAPAAAPRRASSTGGPGGGASTRRTDAPGSRGSTSTRRSDAPGSRDSTSGGPASGERTSGGSARGAASRGPAAGGADPRGATPSGTPGSLATSRSRTAAGDAATRGGLVAPTALVGAPPVGPEVRPGAVPAVLAPHGLFGLGRTDTSAGPSSAYGGSTTSSGSGGQSTVAGRGAGRATGRGPGRTVVDGRLTLGGAGRGAAAAGSTGAAGARGAGAASGPGAADAHGSRGAADVRGAGNPAGPRGAGSAFPHGPGSVGGHGAVLPTSGPAAPGANGPGAVSADRVGMLRTMGAGSLAAALAGGIAAASRAAAQSSAAQSSAAQSSGAQSSGAQSTAARSSGAQSTAARSSAAQSTGSDPARAGSAPGAGHGAHAPGPGRVARQITRSREEYARPTADREHDHAAHAHGTLAQRPAAGPTVSAPVSAGSLRVLGGATMPPGNTPDPVGAVQRTPPPPSIIGTPVQRWSEAVKRRPLEAPRELPSAFQAMARQISGRAYAPRYTTGPATRAALSAAGALGATSGGIVHLSSHPNARNASVLAHELTHTRQAVRRPRFFLSRLTGAVDDDERAALHAGHSHAQGLMGSATQQVQETGAGIVGSLPVAGASMGRVNEVATSAANQAIADANGVVGGAQSTVDGAIGGAQDWFTGASAQAEGYAQQAGGAAQQASGAAHQAFDRTENAAGQAQGAVSGPAPSAPGAAPNTTPGAQPDPIDPDRIVEMVEERLLRELERRGGRWNGVF